MDEESLFDRWTRDNLVPDAFGGNIVGIMVVFNNSPLPRIMSPKDDGVDLEVVLWG